MFVILALFDILICKFFIAIDSDYQPIQDNIMSVELSPAWLYFSFPSSSPWGIVEIKHTQRSFDRILRNNKSVRVCLVTYDLFQRLHMPGF